MPRSQGGGSTKGRGKGKGKGKGKGGSGSGSKKLATAKLSAEAKAKLERDAAAAARNAAPAFNIGVLSQTLEPNPPVVPPSALLRNCNGSDIVRRGKNRRGKFLFSLPAVVARGTANGGTLGAVSKLDTPNPVLYLTFPQGRFKLTGRIIPTTGQFVTMRCGGRSGQVAMIDAFTTLVAFTDVAWIGQRDTNPKEIPLDSAPASLLQPPAKAAGDDADSSDDAGGATSRKPSSSAATATFPASGELDDLAFSQLASSQLTADTADTFGLSQDTVRSGVGAAGAYAMPSPSPPLSDSASGSHVSLASDSDSDAYVLATPAASVRSSGPRRSSARARKTVNYAELDGSDEAENDGSDGSGSGSGSDDVGSDGNDSGDSDAEPRRKRGGKGTSKAKASRKRTGRQASRVSDSEGSDSDVAIVEPPSKPKGRHARAKAKPKAKVTPKRGAKATPKAKTPKAKTPKAKTSSKAKTPKAKTPAKRKRAAAAASTTSSKRPRRRRVVHDSSDGGASDEPSSASDAGADSDSDWAA